MPGKDLYKNIENLPEYYEAYQQDSHFQEDKWRKFIRNEEKKLEATYGQLMAIDEKIKMLSEESANKPFVVSVQEKTIPRSKL